MAAGGGGPKFTFTHLPNDALSMLLNGSRETAELLQKWGFEGRLKSATFTYTNHFQSYLKDSFVLDFFQSPEVNASLQTISSSGSMCPLSLASEVDEVAVEHVPCTQLSMEFFDRLTSTAGVLRENGSIVKCFDEVCDNFVISDELRKVLLMEDSDHYELFSDDERAEFLFRVFSHIVLGGPVNQYEDDIGPYLDTSKMFYKELVTVLRNTKTKSLQVSCEVYKVQAKVGGHLMFPGTSDHCQSFCYLIVDNVKRHVKVWYHVWH